MQHDDGTLMHSPSRSRTAEDICARLRPSYAPRSSGKVEADAARRSSAAAGPMSSRETKDGREKRYWRRLTPPPSPGQVNLLKVLAGLADAKPCRRCGSYVLCLEAEKARKLLCLQCLKLLIQFRRCAAALALAAP